MNSEENLVSVNPIHDDPNLPHAVPQDLPRSLVSQQDSYRHYLSGAEAPRPRGRNRRDILALAMFASSGVFFIVGVVVFTHPPDCVPPTRIEILLSLLPDYTK